MARPQKQTVDYFPHYARASDSKTIFILQNRFGNNGYAFWFKLLELIASHEGHFYDYRKPCEWQFLLAKTGVSADIASQILETLADLEAIDSELYGQHLIWIQKFVDNLADLYKRRKVDLPRKPIISTSNNPISVDINEVSTSNNPQSKVNKSKVNKSIIPPKKPYGEFQNVLLTDTEYQRLQDQFNSETNSLIERLSSYMASKGKRYKNHYATILNWKRKDGNNGKARNPRELPETYTESPNYADL